MNSEAISETKRHYATGKKAHLFQLFDAGNRPSDIVCATVTRKTLYQYFGEWRKERGVKGKKTGFAIKKFHRKLYLEAKDEERRSKERKGIAKLVMDWEAILEALEGWDGHLEHMRETVYLSGIRRYRWLKHVLKEKRDQNGKTIYMTKEENVFLYKKWVKIGKRARDKADFKRACHQEEVGFPPEVDDIE